MEEWLLLTASRTAADSSRLWMYLCWGLIWLEVFTCKNAGGLRCVKSASDDALLWKSIEAQDAMDSCWLIVLSSVSVSE